MPKKIHRRRRRRGIRLENPPPRPGREYKNYVTAVWATPIGDITIEHPFDGKAHHWLRKSAQGSQAVIDAAGFVKMCLLSPLCVSVHLTTNGESKGGLDGPGS